MQVFICITGFLFRCITLVAPRPPACRRWWTPQRTQCCEGVICQTLQQGSAKEKFAANCGTELRVSMFKQIPPPTASWSSFFVPHPSHRRRFNTCSLRTHAGSPLLKTGYTDMCNCGQQKWRKPFWTPGTSGNATNKSMVDTENLLCLKGHRGGYPAVQINSCAVLEDLCGGDAFIVISSNIIYPDMLHRR